MLLNFFVSSLKRTIPEQWWNTYLVAGGDWSEFDVSDIQCEIEGGGLTR
jgi:ATPase complex subunit ATP10